MMHKILTLQAVEVGIPDLVNITPPSPSFGEEAWTYLPMRFSPSGVWVKRSGEWTHYRSEESLKGASFSG